MNILGPGLAAGQDRRESRGTGAASPRKTPVPPAGEPGGTALLPKAQAENHQGRKEKKANKGHKDREDH